MKQSLSILVVTSLMLTGTGLVISSQAQSYNESPQNERDRQNRSVMGLTDHSTHGRARFGQVFPSSTTALAAEASNNTCVHIGRLISIQGEVELKREEWPQYRQTFVGAVLCVGDLLRPSQGATAVVQCADPSQNLWSLNPGVPSRAASGCRPPDTPIKTITNWITPTRDPLANHIPYIITPKSTWLLNDRPTLRWIPVPNATNYVVRVTGPGVEWEREVTTTKVVYPADQPPLQPGAEGYLMKVEANNGSAPGKAIFGLLDRKKATLVRSAAQRLEQQKLTNDAKTLALAELYIGQGLIAEATELLEASAAKGSQTAAVYYLLGNLYAKTNWLQQSERNFLKAVKLATTAKDTEGQAAAAARLGKVYSVMGNSSQAAYWEQHAKKEYQALTLGQQG